MRTVVADANILIALLQPDHADHEYVREVLDDIEPEGDAWSSSEPQAEFHRDNVIAYLHPLTTAEVLHGYPEHHRAGVLDLLTSGAGGFVVADDRPAADEAPLLAQYREQVKMPDACVLALATMLQRPVFTLDKRLMSAALRVSLSVVEDPRQQEMPTAGGDQ